VSAWLELFGRLHPLLVHLPIGAIGAWALLELLALARREPLALPTARALAWLGAASALASAAAGLVLADALGTDDGSIARHRTFGLATAAACVAAAILTSRASTRAAGRVALALSAALVAPTGHLGAALVHGEGYLWEPFAAAPEPAGPTAQALLADHSAAGSDAGGARWESGVAALLNARCGACHGVARQRGGLALDTLAEALAGGKHGPVIVPGDPAASEMVRRLRLAIDVKGHMPPKTKPQPSAAEIAAIEAWIAAGAPGSELPEGALAPPEGAADGEDEEADAEDGLDGAQAAPRESREPEPAALAALRAALVDAARIDPGAAGEPGLAVHFGALPGADDALVTALLEPVAPFVVELSLARTAAGAAAIALCARMPALESLDLAGTGVDAAALAPLAGHARLARLVLAETRIDDSAVETLAALPALRKVYVWGSGLSAAGLERLAAARPELAVDTGGGAESAVLEVEGAIALSGDRPLPGEEAADGPVSGTVDAAAPGAARGAAPINARCPVSGSAVDPRYTLVHGGQVIGFCCPNCPAKFAADPSAYLGALGL
jgi:uncharacterized membrane protein/YHS domain-containing protein